MKIKAQRICDARAFTTYIGNSILIMENSDLGGCETLETPNILCENTSEPSESFFECKHVRE